MISGLVILKIISTTFVHYGFPSIIFYRYHTFLATLIQFVDIEMVIFLSLERRLVHSVFYWTFLASLQKKKNEKSSM